MLSLVLCTWEYKLFLIYKIFLRPKLGKKSKIFNSSARQKAKPLANSFRRDQLKAWSNETGN